MSELPQPQPPQQPGPLHQPPDPADLQRVPPVTPDCARIRGLLRDFADLDLPPVLQTAVENHVHHCRDCALALARSEFEVLRLRRAFLGNWTPTGPRPGFARRAVERLLREDSVVEAAPMSGSEPASDVAPSPDARLADLERAGIEVPRIDLTRKILARASADLAASSRSPGPARPGSQGWALASAFAVSLCVLAVCWVWQEAVAFGSAVRLSIVHADNAWSGSDQSMVRARAGDGLGDGDVLRVDRDGAAIVEWHDQSMSGKQPAARMQMQGDGELRLCEGSPQLVRGTIEVASERPMCVLLGDGSRALLGQGQYHIDATETASFDELLSAANNLAVRVEVLQGEQAVLELETGVSEVIGVGQYGSYARGYAGIAVENQPSTPMPNAAPIAAGPLPGDEPDEPDLTGRIIDHFGGPVAGAQVTLSYLVGGALQQYPLALATDVAGRFELPRDSGIRDGFVVLQVEPPAGRLDLGILPPNLYPLQHRVGGVGYSVAPVDVSTGGPLTGQVLDQLRQPLDHVQLVPCVYDELLGQIWPWLDGITYSDAGGGFALYRMPGRLPPHQRLGVFAFHPQFDTEFEPLPLPTSPAGMAGGFEVRLQPLLTLTFSGLPPATQCLVCEEPIRLQPGTGLRRYRLESNAAGQALAMQVGRGRLWLQRDGEHLQRIAPTGEVLAETTAFADVFRSLVDVGSAPQLLAPTAAGLYLASQTRYDDFHSPPIGEGTNLPALDPGGNYATAAQVFALASRQTGGTGVRFLGFSSDANGLSVQLAANETELAAVSSFDGATLQTDVEDLWFHGRLNPMRLRSTGSVLFAETRRPPGMPRLLLRFLPTDFGSTGSRPMLYRYVSANNSWLANNIPAGSYLVLDDLMRSLSITIPPQGTVELR